ncbi:hypothetical protein ACJMK2_006772 [Sinanodonta woodiana]|uniref:Mediator of RNA polymerase II transcription subunit 28 n=1 Tax=Sinanodonta woodiana TaxID=1069815 RepID=A0ABD3VVI1_SINWO
MATPMEQMQTVGNNPHLMDELESSFHNCLALMTDEEHFNVQDSDETKTSIENAIQKFLDLSREMEEFFLRKRLMLSHQKPEQLLSDDIFDLKFELSRKEQILEKHMERLNKCQMILQSGGGGLMGVGQSHPPIQTQQSQPQTQAPPPIPSMIPSHSMQSLSSQATLPLGAGQPGMGQFQGQGQLFQHPSQTPVMSPHTVPMTVIRPQPPPSYPQGPLAFLEQTMSNIGMPDNRR